MAKQSVTLGDAPSLPPHPPADMLDLFMTRYDYDYNRFGPTSGSDGGGDGGDRDKGDGISGAVRNRPIFGTCAADGEMDGNTTYRVDYVPPKTAADLALLVAAAYSRGDGNGGGEDGVAAGVFARQWFTLPGGTRMDASDISIYKTDYTPNAVDRATMRSTVVRNADGTPATVPLFAGAASVPYKADFLTVKGGAEEDDGADITPKITSEESLRAHLANLKAAEEGNKKSTPLSAAAAARFLMTSASAPWIPGSEHERTTTGSNHSNMTTGSGPVLGGPAADGAYSCESWLYGDETRAHPSQLPQGIAGSVHEGLVTSLLPGTMGMAASVASWGAEGNVADLLRRLAGQTQRPHAVRGERPLDLFEGARAGMPGAGAAVELCEDETNPVHITAREQGRCAITNRLTDEGHVKGTSIYKGDYVDQGRLPELPGNRTGGGDPRATNVTARATVGEMQTGVLTAQSRSAAVLRNSHGALLSNARISDRAMAGVATLSCRNTNAASERLALGAAEGAVPPADVLDTMRGMERRERVGRADPHRRKLL